MAYCRDFGIKNLQQKSVIYLGLPILSLVYRLNCRSMCQRIHGW